MDPLVIELLLIYFGIALAVAIKLGKDDEWSDNAVIFLAIFWPIVVLLAIFVCILFMMQCLFRFIKKKFKRKGE